MLRKFMLLLTALVMMVSMPALGQGFDFSEGGGGDDGGGDDGGGDDGFDFGEGGDDGGGDGFDFGSEGTQDNSAEKEALGAIVMPDGSKPIIAAFFFPVEGENTPPEDLLELSNALVEHFNEFEEYDAVNGLAIKFELDEMEDMDREACVYDPACLARLGTDLGVQKVVVGRIQGGGNGQDRPLISLDLTDVETKATENIIEFEAHPRSIRKRKKELRPAAFKLFGKEIILIDPTKCVEDGGSKDCSEDQGGIPPGQLWGAIGAGVAGLAFLGTGIAFGLSASGTMDDLNSQIANRQISQSEAQSLKDGADSDALLANIMYGLAGVSVATAVVLLLVRPDEEIAEDQFETGGDEEGASIEYYIAPQISSEGAGFMGGLRF